MANILHQRNHPVSRKELEEELEVARATLTRDLTVLREQLNMPIVYDREGDGYFLARDGMLVGPRYELPGVWLTPDQGYAVLALTNVLMTITGPILAQTLRPLRLLLKQIVGSRRDSIPPVWERISIEVPGIDNFTPGVFRVVSEAMFSEKQASLSIGGKETGRGRFSLQHFVLTANGWQLDAYSEREKKMVRIPCSEITKATVLMHKARQLEWSGTHWEDAKGRIIAMEPVKTP